MSAARYVALAITTLAIDAAAVENEAPKAARTERDAWEIAWSVALYEHLAARRDKSAAWDKWDSVPWHRERSDAREIYKRPGDLRSGPGKTGCGGRKELPVRSEDI